MGGCLLILGVGTDLCGIMRIRRSVKRFGERFTSRFCTERERGWIETARDPGLFYAQSFAAKEALAKALGTGFDEDVDPITIEVFHMRPPIAVVFAGAAADKLNALVPDEWIAKIHVSVGTCREFASASAVVSASLKSFISGHKLVDERF
jgi:holo-[acyl-carrier protein] synthase